MGLFSKNKTNETVQQQKPKNEKVKPTQEAINYVCICEEPKAKEVKPEPVKEVKKAAPVKPVEKKVEVVEEPVKEEGLTLKESLQVAASVGAKDTVSKAAIIKHLESFGSKLELNARANYTAPGKGKTEGLPLADTHYVVGAKKVCFTYVYEDTNGSVLLLVRTTKAHFEEIKAKHVNANMSRFPKVREGNAWYSIPVDDSFTEQEIYDVLDKAIENA